MPLPLFPNSAWLAAPALALWLVITLIAGCATSPSRTPSVPTSATHSATSEPTPVIRYGRYTLVEMVPDPSQQDLMQQVIDLTVPATANTTVGDTLRYVLLGSGYQLCDNTEATQALDGLPLPAAHTHVGPLNLRDALQMLAGRAWQLEVDDTTRHVCFAPKAAKTVEHNP